jgi:hypothetical protein
MDKVRLVHLNGNNWLFRGRRARTSLHPSQEIPAGKAIYIIHARLLNTTLPHSSIPPTNTVFVPQHGYLSLSAIQAHASKFVQQVSHLTKRHGARSIALHHYHVHRPLDPLLESLIHRAQHILKDSSRPSADPPFVV